MFMLIQYQKKDQVGLRFAVVGDWGVPRTPWEDKEDAGMIQTQLKVGKAINAWATEMGGIHFIVSSGDHAYPRGLRSLAETPRLDQAFEQSYSGASIKDLQWYGTLGNHDCSGDTDAQYEYAKTHPRFNMEPYYKVLKESPGSTPSSGSKLFMFVLDMCTFVCGGGGQARDERCSASDDKTWGHIPEVASRGSDARAEMVTWFKKEVSAAGCGASTSVRTWCIVVGHWPAFSFAGNGPTDKIIDELVPVLKEAGVQAYFSGHDHNLQAIQHGDVSYFVSGAGGYNLHPSLKENIAQASIPLNKGAESKFLHIGSGFMGVSIGLESMEVNAIDGDGNIIRSFLVPYNRDSRESAFVGRFLDPKHPRGYRTVKIEGSQAIVRGIDEPNDSEWELKGNVAADSITVNFRPKGGPAHLVGTLVHEREGPGLAGIRWLGGITWLRAHESGYVGGGGAPAAPAEGKGTT